MESSSSSEDEAAVVTTKKPSQPSVKDIKKAFLAPAATPLPAQVTLAELQTLYDKHCNNYTNMQSELDHCLKFQEDLRLQRDNTVKEKEK